MKNRAFRTSSFQTREGCTFAIVAMIGAALFSYLYGPFPADMQFLAAIFALAIFCVGMLYRSAANTPEYRGTILLFMVAHVVALLLIDPAWLPKQSRSLAAIGIPDYFLMAWLFPKISGLRFEDEPPPSEP